MLSHLNSLLVVLSLECMSDMSLCDSWISALTGLCTYFLQLCTFKKMSSRRFIHRAATGK